MGSGETKRSNRLLLTCVDSSSIWAAGVTTGAVRAMISALLGTVDKSQSGIASGALNAARQAGSVVPKFPIGPLFVSAVRHGARRGQGSAERSDPMPEYNGRSPAVSCILVSWTDVAKLHSRERASPWSFCNGKNLYGSKYR